jgi:hypothetical protein
MMKLLQEVRGFAEIANRRPHQRPPGPVLLQARAASPRTPGKLKRTLKIAIQEPPDIPHPVRITYLGSR